MPILADFQPEGWDEDAESCSICHALLGRRRETRCFFVGGKPSAVHLVYTCLHHAFFIRKIGIWLDMYYPAKRTTVCVYIYICLSLCVCVQTEYLSVESSLQKSSFDLFFGAANLRVF